MQKTHAGSRKIALIQGALMCHIAILTLMEINMPNLTRPVKKFEVADSHALYKKILSGERLRSTTLFNKAKTTIKSANGVVVKLRKTDAQQFSKMPFNTHLIASVLR